MFGTADYSVPDIGGKALGVKKGSVYSMLFFLVLIVWSLLWFWKPDDKGLFRRIRAAPRGDLGVVC